MRALVYLPGTLSSIEPTRTHDPVDSGEQHKTPPPPPPHPPRQGNAMPAYVRLCQCVQCVFNTPLFFTHVLLCGCQVHGRRLIQRLQMTQLLILETLLLLLVEVTHVCMCHNMFNCLFPFMCNRLILLNLASSCSAR